MPQLAKTLGAAVGVLFGCVLGMGSLFFMDLDSKDREKRQMVGYTDVHSPLEFELLSFARFSRCSLIIHCTALAGARHYIPNRAGQWVITDAE